MKKSNVKKVILAVTLLLILFVATNVYATGTSDSPLTIPVINTTTTPANETTNVTTNTTNIVTPTNITTNTTTSTYTNTTLPKTGDASDYAIFLLIAVAVVIAIYAYKKVRDYNIK